MEVMFWELFQLGRTHQTVMVGDTFSKLSMIIGTVSSSFNIKVHSSSPFILCSYRSIIFKLS